MVEKHRQSDEEITDVPNDLRLFMGVCGGREGGGCVRGDWGGVDGEEVVGGDDGEEVVGRR